MLGLSCSWSMPLVENFREVPCKWSCLLVCGCRVAGVYQRSRDWHLKPTHKRVMSEPNDKPLLTMGKIYFQWPQSDASFALSGCLRGTQNSACWYWMKRKRSPWGLFFPGSGKSRELSLLFRFSSSRKTNMSPPWVHYCFFFFFPWIILEKHWKISQLCTCLSFAPCCSQFSCRIIILSIKQNFLDT